MWWDFAKKVLEALPGFEPAMEVLGGAAADNEFRAEAVKQSEVQNECREDVRCRLFGSAGITRRNPHRPRSDAANPETQQCRRFVWPGHRVSRGRSQGIFRNRQICGPGFWQVDGDRQRLRTETGDRRALNSRAFLGVCYSKCCRVTHMFTLVFTWRCSPSCSPRGMDRKVLEA